MTTEVPLFWHPEKTAPSDSIHEQQTTPSTEQPTLLNRIIQFTTGDKSSGGGGGSARTPAAVNADIRMPSTTLPISRSLLTIRAQQIVMEGSEFNVTLIPNAPLTFHAFEGTALFKHDTVILTGTLARYTDNGVAVDWHHGQAARIRITNGTVALENQTIKYLGGSATGTIDLDHRMNIDLRNDTVAVQQYQGNITYVLDGSGRFQLDGTAGSITIDSTEYALNVF